MNLFSMIALVVVVSSIVSVGCGGALDPSPTDDAGVAKEDDSATEADVVVLYNTVCFTNDGGGQQMQNCSLGSACTFSHTVEEPVPDASFGEPSFRDAGLEAFEGVCACECATSTPCTCP